MRTLINHLYKLTIAIFSLWFAFSHWLWFVQQKWPIERDAFFYLTQFRSLRENHHGFYPTHEFSFTLFKPILFYTNIPELTVYKFLVLGSHVLLAGALGMIARKKVSLLVGLLVLSATLASTNIFFLVSTFPCQALALGLAFCGLYCVFEETRRSKYLGALLLVTATVVHLVAVPVAVGTLFSQTTLKKHWWCGAAVLIAAVLAWKKIFLMLISLKWTGTMPWFGFGDTFGPAEILSYLTTYLFACYFGYLICRKLFLSSEQEIFTSGADQLGFIFLGLGILLQLPIWDDDDQFCFRFLMSAAPFIWCGIILVTRFLKQQVSTAVFFTLMTVLNLNAEVVGRPTNALLNSITLEAASAPIRNWLPENSFISAPHGTQFRANYFFRRPAGRIVPAHSQSVYRLTDEPPAFRCPVDVRNHIGAIPSEVDCIALGSRWYLYRDKMLEMNQCEKFVF